MPRSWARFSPWFCLLSLCFACGGGARNEPGARASSGVAGDGRGGSSGREADADAGAGPAGDPICGEHWKWDGNHCVAIDDVAKAAAGGFSSDGGASSEHASRSGEGTGKPTSLTSGGGGGAGDASSAQLVIEDLRVGTGAEAKPGDTVRVHYVGKLLQDGTEFDSSRKRGSPLEVRLGAGMVIKGFDRGILGMKVGGLRKVTIPPDLAYGRKGVPPLIPPRATLVFELELMDVI